MPSTTESTIIQTISGCNDLTFDKCNGEPPFLTLTLSNEKVCQTFCNEIFHDCIFFIYDRQHDICQLYDYDSQKYVESCALVAATPVPSLDKCKSLDDDCLVRNLKTKDIVKFSDQSHLTIMK